MAFPIILVDSATGSDTAASGAGPSTALTGTAGATDVAGTTVTLDAGTDLSGVATDGSAAIYMNNTTAGQRRYAKITGTAGSGGATPTVTVAEAYTGSLSGKTWAIGGKRASIGAASSKVLFDNNSTAGDAMPGWVVELQSGHTETISATLDMRRSGSNSVGPIMLRGVSGAATVPVVTFSNNGNGLVSRGAGQILQDFELRNSNATKTASTAILGATGAGFLALRMKIAHSTNKFWKAISLANGPCAVVACEVGHTASVGIESPAGSSHALCRNNYVHDCGGHGINCTTSGTGSNGVLLGNLVVNNGSDGINYSVGPFSGSPGVQLVVRDNVIAGNVGDGFEMNMALGLTPWTHADFTNNLFVSNGGYGLNFSNASATAAALAFYQVQIQSNAFYNNTSGALNPSGVGVDSVTLTGDPFTNAASGDFSLNNTTGAGAACRAAGYISTFPGGLTLSYRDIGAAQHQDSGGSSGGCSILGGAIVRSTWN